jgi:hypothetical protein
LAGAIWALAKTAAGLAGDLPSVLSAMASVAAEILTMKDPACDWSPASRLLHHPPNGLPVYDEGLDHFPS